MRQFKIGLIFGLFLLLGGCETGQNPTEVGTTAGVKSTPVNLGKISLPPGATVKSAILYLHFNYGYKHLNSVHRITADWDEMTVNWANFGSAFDPAEITTFTPGAADSWNKIDITSLVAGWVDGTYDDYGILLRVVHQGIPADLSWWLAEFSSSNAATNRPYLKLVYESGGKTDSVEIRHGGVGNVWDAYIWDGHDNNVGSSPYLYTGYKSGLEKMTLIKFELNIANGCTRTIGYWKTHGPTPTGNNKNMWLPVTGLKLGSVQYTDAQLLRILNQPVRGNGLVSLAHQLIGAKLNIAHGADGTAVSAAIVDADALIGSLVVPPIGTGFLLPSATGTLNTMLTDYNEGTTGPGHCEDGLQAFRAVRQ